MWKCDKSLYFIWESRYVIFRIYNVNACLSPSYKWYVPFTYVTQERRNDVKIEWMAMESGKALHFL